MTIEEIIAKGKQYTIVLLKRGPNYDNMEANAVRQNQIQHLQYLFDLRGKGILAINGPVTDESEIVGVSIYNSSDKQEVESFVTNDPGVISERLFMKFIAGSVSRVINLVNVFIHLLSAGSHKFFSLHVNNATSALV